MSSRALNVAANGAITQDKLGSFSYIYLRVCTNPVQISFDGDNWQNANLNDSFGPLTPQPTRVYFRAVGGLAASVAFDFGDTPFRAQSTFQKVASTYAKGSAQNFSGIWTIYPIPSGDNGHQRKSIVFTVKSGPVTILDQNLQPVCRVVSTAPIALETDSIFYFAIESGGTAGTLTIGEIYYS